MATLRGTLLPAALFPAVLHLEPVHQGAEVIDDRRRVHLALPGERLERVRPRAAHPHLQHLRELRPGLLVAVDRAAVERTGVAALLAERPVELELEDARQ